MRVKMSPGLVARSSLGPRFHFSSAVYVTVKNSAVALRRGRVGGLHVLPGLKFSITTWERSASRRTSLFEVFLFLYPLIDREGVNKTYARPSSLRRSIETLFLLRARLRNHGLVPSTSSSRQPRNGSPVFGGSTLMISAPKCLKNR